MYPEVREGRFRTDFIFQGNRPENIRSGQTYYIDLQLGEPTESVLIPKGTFFQVTGGNWIFVVDKDGKKAYRRKSASDVRIRSIMRCWKDWKRRTRHRFRL